MSGRFVLDEATISDLARFSTLELASRDVEPWADLIADLRTAGDLDTEQALWVLYLYNAHDDFGAAWTAFTRWESPRAWATAKDSDDAADLPIMTERRNLYGGRMLRRHSSYVAELRGNSQRWWLRQGLRYEVPTSRAQLHANWFSLMGHLRNVWGVGRQAAFEWAEFVVKVAAWPAEAPDGCLWESSGPRESLERLYLAGHRAPSRAWLEAAAHQARASIADASGLTVPWVDFETVICDFNVMRKGRYYVGQHLAALAGEIDTAPSAHVPFLRTAWARVIPEPWCQIAPGIDREQRGRYKADRTILDAPSRTRQETAA